MIEPWKIGIASIIAYFHAIVGRSNDPAEPDTAHDALHDKYTLYESAT